MAGKRPTPHVDNTATQADDTFVPTFTPASAPTEYVNVLMHGDNGTGKTHAAGTYPNPVFLSLDPGFATLKKLPNADGIQIVRVPDKARGDRAPLLQLWDVVLWLQKGDHDRQTVVLDSVTDLYKMILVAVMRKQRQRESATIPATDDYIEAGAKLEAICQTLRDLPMNTVFTAHHKILKKKDDVIGIRPNLSEKLSTTLGGMCDLVMHTTVHEKQDESGNTLVAYVGQTVPINGIQAKDRSGNLRTPFTQLGYEVVAAAYGMDGVPPAPGASDEPEPEDAPEATDPELLAEADAASAEGES